MTYMENVLICLAAPLLIAVLCAGRRRRQFLLFLLAGMLMCLLSAYVNSFFARFYGMSLADATVQLAPAIEEIMKLLPLLFFLLVFDPDAEQAAGAIVLIAAGFATFENTCYLIEHGASQLTFLFLRGFGTGAMHIICGAIVGRGLLRVWKRPWLKAAGTVGLLCVAITYHAIYNLLLSAGGAAQAVGLGIPVLTVLLGMVFRKLPRPTLPD